MEDKAKQLLKSVNRSPRKTSWLAGRWLIKKKASFTTLILLITSIACISFSVGYRLDAMREPSFQYKPRVATTHEVNTLNTPVAIHITSVKVKLPIEESYIVNGEWQVSDKRASFLATSARPGNNSNIVIYGHNTDAIFGRIRGVKQGDTIILRSQDNGLHFYTVTQTLVINPEQIEVVLPTKNEVLTIFTCDGFADTKRFVVRAKPVSSI